MAAEKTDFDEGQAIVKAFESFVGQRSNWENHWRKIARYFYTGDDDNFSGGAAGSLSTSGRAGERRTEHIFDSTAPLSLSRLRSIMESILTPRHSYWHKLRPDNTELAKERKVREWFDEVNRILFKYRYLPAANFTSQNGQTYGSIAGYGTGAMFIDEAKSGRGFRYRNVHISQIYVGEDHQGRVNEVFRRFELTAEQAVQRWGDGVPERIKEKMATDPQSRHVFLHHVKERQDRDPEAIGEKGMAYESTYVSLSEEKKVIHKGGYKYMPYAIGRFGQSSGEVYGRSPAMDVLDSTKTLNAEKRDVLTAGHRAVNPIFLAHDDGALDNVKMVPGAVVGGGLSEDGKRLVDILPFGDVRTGKELMDDERAIIQDAFYLTLFHVLTKNPQMTATESLERTKEKSDLLSPPLGAVESEYLGNVIDRELSILELQGGILPEPPGVLIEAGGEYEIVFETPLAKMRKAKEAAGVMRLVETLASLSNMTQNPSLMDRVDPSKIIRLLGDAWGVPPDVFSTDEDVARLQKLREGRQQELMAQERMAKEAQMVQAGAAMEKAEGQSPR